MDFVNSEPSEIIMNCFEDNYNNEFDIELNEILVAAVSLDKKYIHEHDDTLTMFNSHNRELIKKTRDNMGVNAIKKLIIDVMLANREYYDFYLKKAQQNSIISSLFCERAWRDMHKTSLSFKHVSKDYLCIFATRFMSKKILNIIQNKYTHSETKLLPIEYYYQKCEYLLCQTLPMLGMADSKSIETYKMYGFSALQEVLSQTLNDKFCDAKQYDIDKEKIINNILSLYYKNDAPKYNLPTESLLQSMANTIVESIFNVKEFNIEYVKAKKTTEPCYKIHLDKKTTKEHLIEYMSIYIKLQIKKNKGEQVIISYTPPLADFICSHGLQKETPSITQSISRPFYETLRHLVKNHACEHYAENRTSCNIFYDTAKNNMNLCKLNMKKT